MEKYQIIDYVKSLGFTYDGNELNNGTRFSNGDLVVTVKQKSLTDGVFDLRVQVKNSLKLMDFVVTNKEELLHNIKKAVESLTSFKFDNDKIIDDFKYNLPFFNFKYLGNYNQTTNALYEVTMVGLNLPLFITISQQDSVEIFNSEMNLVRKEEYHTNKTFLEVCYYMYNINMSGVKQSHLK